MPSVERGREGCVVSQAQDSFSESNRQESSSAGQEARGPRNAWRCLPELKAKKHTAIYFELGELHSSSYATLHPGGKLQEGQRSEWCSACAQQEPKRPDRLHRVWELPNKTIVRGRTALTWPSPRIW